MRPAFLDPNFADGFSSLGQYHINQKEFAEAKRSFEKAKELDSDDTNLMLSHPEIFQHAPLKSIASFLGITDTSLCRIRKDFIKK